MLNQISLGDTYKYFGRLLVYTTPAKTGHQNQPQNEQKTPPPHSQILSVQER